MISKQSYVYCIYCFQQTKTFAKKCEYFVRSSQTFLQNFTFFANYFDIKYFHGKKIRENQLIAQKTSLL